MINQRHYIRFLFLLFVSLPFVLHAQVDVTKYASDDLFEVKPVMTREFLEKEQEVVPSNTTWFENEVTRGMDHLTNGELDDALDIFANLIEDYPETAFLNYYIGLIYYNKEQYDNATEQLEEALQKDPLFLDAKYFLGLIDLNRGNAKEAKKKFKILLTVPEYAAHGHHGMGIIALNVGNTYRAYAQFKKCIEQDSTFMEAYLPMLSMDLFYGRVRSARKLVEKGISAKKDWQEGIMVRGMIALLQDENTQQFEQDLDYLIELAPDNYHYHSMRGFLQMELGNYHQAVENFKTAYNLQVDSIRTGEFKFNTKLEKNETMQSSLNYYDEHFEMEPDVRLYVDRAICEVMSGNNTTALSLLDSADQLEETTVSHTLKGAIFRSMWNRDKEAVRAFSMAIAMDSAHWMAHKYRAATYLELGYPDSAYTDLEKLIQLKPRRKEGYKNRGIILLENEYYSKAYRDFSTGLSIDPTDNDLYFNRAMAAMRMGYLKEAKSDLSVILDRKPDDGESYYYLYLIHLSEKDTSAAISLLDSASKYSKYKLNYHEELLALALSTGRTNTCIAAHDRLVRYHSYNPNRLLERGKYLYEVKKYQEAIKDLSKFLKKRKKSGEGYYFLGRSLLVAGQEKEGQKYLRKATKLGYRPSE